MRRISPEDERTSSPLSQQSMDKPYKPKFHVYPGKSDLPKVSTGKMSSGVAESFIPTLGTSTVTTSSASNTISSKPSSTGGSNFVLSASTAESVKQHIQKLISQNSAIIDGVEPALQKKYHKITGINRSISVDNSIVSSMSSNNVTHQRKTSLSIPPRELPSHQINLAAHAPMTVAPNNIVIVAPKTPAIQNPINQIQFQSQTQLMQPLQATPHSVQIIQQPIMYSSATSNVPSSPLPHQQTTTHVQGPLNLVTKLSMNEVGNVKRSPRSRKTSQEITEQVPVVDHPKNPERSIIKDLLLNSRTFGVVAEGETNETPYICLTCKKVFQTVDLLRYHTFCHCDGASIGAALEQNNAYDEQSPQSAPISPVASPHQYIRSNSIHASTISDAGQLKHGKIMTGNSVKIIKPKQKPDNIIINSNESPVIESASIDQFHLLPHVKMPLVELTQAPLPSPGPLLGKTPLIDMYHIQRIGSTMDGSQVIERKSSEPEDYNYRLQQLHHSKRPRYNSINGVELSPPNMHRNTHRLDKVQMFGGDVKILEKSSMGQYSSGGTMSSLSPNSDEMMEDAPVIVRTGLYSGGIAVPMEKDKTEKLPMTPKLVLTITPTLTITQTTQSIYQQKQASSQFQFPPLNPITGYNPLTLPPVTTSPGQVQSIMHGGKLIPYVPGIPGPNTFNSKVENMSKKIMASPKIPLMPFPRTTIVPNNIPVQPIKLEPFNDGYNMSGNVVRVAPQKQSFNFSRIADNISPNKKSEQEESVVASVVKLHQDQTDVRIFNYENLIAKNEIIVRSGSDAGVATVIKQSNIDDKSKVKEESLPRPNKFLRPSSLPLKPGTFTPKQHHGITPTANTLPLISPETPRPSKTCVQQYHNGHAYTYLGLKCSTKPFYCTVNKPQPAYCVTQAKLSMYSNWQVYPESKPHPLKLKPLDVMQCYRSYFKFERNRKFSIANTLKTSYTLVNSSEIRISAFEAATQFANPQEHNSKFGVTTHHATEETNNGNGEEEYVRGRGRGKYICETCGIRCKKPSMLKKHIRTHTDERPHTCTNCNFSFKTKGNLTKHMKSKAHYKKCIELGIPVEEYQGSEGDNASGGPDRHNLMNTGFEDESENENDSDCDEDTESDDNEDNRSRLPEHEAARCLLSLSMTPPATNLINNQQKQQPPSNMKENFLEQRLDEISCRRIITFAAPKTEFDLHGQYYSDPNTIKVHNERTQIKQQVRQQSGETEESPIDLTKRSKATINPISQEQLVAQKQQQGKLKVSDVVLPITDQASLLASLMSITDKFPVQNQNGVHGVHFGTEQPNLPHKYITDRALLDVKIKQNQIKLMVNVANNCPEVTENHTVESHSIDVQPQEQRGQNMDETEISMMDTLAEVAASSVKLDVTPIHSPKLVNEENNSCKPVNTVETESRNSNAKSIATEILKLTQNVKIHEKMSENEGDGESGSDQDALIDKYKATRTVVVGPGAFSAINKKTKTSDSKPFIQEEGRPLCPICKKVFPKQSALKLHLNIHAMERKYKCDPCGQGFRTQGHLQKHNRSAQHQTKVSMTSTFGVPSQSNPRPFKCKDCSTQFRIHGHLAKHLRSKLHVMRLECLQKLPFGTYAEIERSGISLTNIDTSDCDTSLAGLQELARKIHEQDPTKLIPVIQGNVTQGGLSQTMEDLEDENAGTGLESDGDYLDSDEGNDITNSQAKKTIPEPINGLKRPYLTAFAAEMHSPLKIQQDINNDTEKSEQDPLKLDTPPPRPVSAISIASHQNDVLSTEKKFKPNDLSNDT